ncbi:GalNAc(5)-diNAcBac-PP-undecaprenol beta-1,3-glucosyltransferase [Chryseobacterium aquaeductus]|uniref:GalNAc(5)-diNAcBac-PP-undecaprenol beta-1,3-glucosyltransferase n=1 Tax=Chryseobacterium aquaeductus TaxID=2675056 RepID=A0A9N8QV76_9FLAO|nr:glycosyltransferase [Chryseobacterium aquaeductus]CAA7331603.1 GalNAc(5)-diNAcBac-PP-undecaprenol beta-1,3-glucosyltransferase [Chryseobacterium potabilaquae]CAD7811194.1 GalNAc(5)-diNAcBac-PP-undecaprenol beta-1,3-glucosyltransferase [Chryseobacterium aquaeductus]
MKPLLSIAIATKDREKYCIQSIQSILSLEYKNIEITLSDNSATTQVRDFVDKLQSDQIVYRYDNSAVSSIENFNRAVELTTGEYVMLIGDDDTILPKAIEMAQWAKNNNVDSVCSKETIIYYWPKALEKYPDGAVIIPKTTNNLKKINVKNELITLLKSGLQNYLLYSLPKTYHGLVKRNVLEEIKRRTGHFYGGLSPDLYSAVAVACVGTSHYQIGEPLSVAGVCATSTTADNVTGKHSGTLENIPHLRHRTGYVFDKRIPKYYSVNTIWAESGLKALEELKEFELLKQFNMFYLLAQGKIHNNKFIPEIIKIETEKMLSENNIDTFQYKIQNAKALSIIFYRKFFSILKAKMNKDNLTIIENVSDIQKIFELYKS